MQIDTAFSKSFDKEFVDSKAQTSSSVIGKFAICCGLSNMDGPSLRRLLLRNLLLHYNVARKRIAAKF